MQFINKIAATSLIAVLVFSTASAQITLTGNDYLSKPAVVITETIKAEGIATPGGVGTLSANDRITTYKYLDGFGRPLQDVAIKATPDNKDLIKLYTYDEFGRETKQYLPFAFTSTLNGQPYQDRPTAITSQASFYTTNTAANKIAADTKPYAQSEIELSPMQRMIKQGNVGDGFQTNQHFKSANYRTNDANDNVRKWAADGTSSGTYSINELTVTEGTDENNVKGIVFTDKMGRIVLKRQQADELIGGTTYPWFDTYFVYDLAGNVAYVLPPKAVAKLATLGTWNVTSVPNLYFSYTYDNKGRVTEKKVPGADKVYIVYDPIGRIVLTQNGTMRAGNKWFYSKHDAQGRVLIEGVYTDATHITLASMQSYVNGLACYSASSTTYYEERATGSAPWYTNNCFPTSGTEARIYYYYDDYDFDNNGTANYAYEAQGLPGEGTATSATTGHATGVMKKILGTSNWLTTVSFYDKRYNLIQVKSDNQLKVATVNDKVTNVIDFGGRLKESRTWKSPVAGTNSATVDVRNTYSYDKMNRLTEVKQGHSAGAQIIVAKYEYNPLGQMVDKKLHSTNGGSSFLQSVDFRYNIRGQLGSINNSSLSNDGGQTNDESNDVWGMNLLYDNVDASLGNTANYTGLLSAVRWKAVITAGNNDERSYTFAYDKLYRLTGATYKAKTGGTWTKDVNGFNESASYDWNGNILSMRRNAVLSGVFTADIDNMTYDYGAANDNDKLLNVTEAGNNSFGFRNFTGSGASTAYTYDVNGNLTGDLKKGITLTYNDLNKPVRITETASGRYVEYGYDAAGVRISRTVYDGTTTKTINYVGGVVFDENNGLSYFGMAEGRIRNNSGTLVFEYFITDHQGNVRVSFEDNGSGQAVARQENSYYPFGMIMPGSYEPTNANKKLYNAGSEWENAFSGLINYYSTFFREYDPVLGRFNGVDPKAEIGFDLSVYHYAGNNPINYNDPLGDWKTPSIWDMNGWEGHGGWRSFGLTQADIEGLWRTTTAGQFLRQVINAFKNGFKIEEIFQLSKDGQNVFTSFDGYKWQFLNGEMVNSAGMQMEIKGDKVRHIYKWYYEVNFKGNFDQKYTVGFRFDQIFEYYTWDDVTQTGVESGRWWDFPKDGIYDIDKPYIYNSSGLAVGTLAEMKWSDHKIDWTNQELYLEFIGLITTATPIIGANNQNWIRIEFRANYTDPDISNSLIFYERHSLLYSDGLRLNYIDSSKFFKFEGTYVPNKRRR